MIFVVFPGSGAAIAAARFSDCQDFTGLEGPVGTVAAIEFHQKNAGAAVLVAATAAACAALRASHQDYVLVLPWANALPFWTSSRATAEQMKALHAELEATEPHLYHLEANQNVGTVLRAYGYDPS